MNGRVRAISQEDARPDWIDAGGKRKAQDRERFRRKVCKAERVEGNNKQDGQ